jgi:hypothetical protein
MKKVSTLLVALLIAAASTITLSSFSTVSPEYFEGKWAVTVMDTPQGNATIPMRFETVDGKTTGYFMEDPAGKEMTMSSVTIDGDILNASFNISGYDVTLTLKKTEEDFSKGSLMSMFPAEAKRVKG